jgi:hypothetical protein
VAVVVILEQPLVLAVQAAAVMRLRLVLGRLLLLTQVAAAAAAEVVVLAVLEVLAWFS